MSLTLYKATELASLESHVDDETGEINLEAFDAAQITLADKRLAVVAYIKNQTAECSMLEQAIKELQGQLKTRDNRIESLKEYLAHHMKETGITAIESADLTFSAKLQIGVDKAVEIDDGAIFPASLCLPPKDPAPSKKLIKEAIERGEAVAGARIVKRDRLTIK